MRRFIAAVLLMLGCVACRQEPIIERVPADQYTPPPTTPYVP